MCMIIYICTCTCEVFALGTQRETETSKHIMITEKHTQIKHILHHIVHVCIHVKAPVCHGFESHLVQCNVQLNGLSLYTCTCIIIDLDLSRTNQTPEAHVMMVLYYVTYTCINRCKEKQWIINNMYTWKYLYTHNVHVCTCA